MTQRQMRCAIYTRKSTEEGLDQAFNSLDAQREACAAYILSQAGEGWTALPTYYDDGGFSGGNMERPALVSLLNDVDRGRVDVVVVYKIDRLTRSLADFAKIVERFEKHDASFVSVTQAFNTTSSMGRLTLNVLLSFAQFEREVTAERIRDKVSASRKKGIFMGGNPPLGYDPKERKLVINPDEAETVRFIFQRYLELGSVSRLRAALEAKNIRTKAWVSTRGNALGGGPWFIGPLRHILRNRVYVGEAVHKGTAYPGEHEAIITRELFDAVQAKLETNRASHVRRKTIGSDALLTGMIFDDAGNAMSPSKSRRDNSFHLYYVSQALVQGRDPTALRIPAIPVEAIVTEWIERILEARKLHQLCKPNGMEPDEPSNISEHVRDLVTRVDVSINLTNITFKADALSRYLEVKPGQVQKATEALLDDSEVLEVSDSTVVVTVSKHLKQRGGAKRIEGWDRTDWTAAKASHDPTLIKALTQAHEWRQWIETGEILTVEDLTERTGSDRKSVRQILRLAFLAPDIQRAILTGRQPKSLSYSALIELDPPAPWSEQRSLLRFTAPV